MSGRYFFLRKLEEHNPGILLEEGAVLRAGKDAPLASIIKILHFDPYKDEVGEVSKARRDADNNTKTRLIAQLTSRISIYEAEESRRFVERRQKRERDG